MLWLHEFVLFQKSFSGTNTWKLGSHRDRGIPLVMVVVKVRFSPARAAGTGSLSVKSQLEALLTQRLGSEERTTNSTGNLCALGVQSWL